MREALKNPSALFRGPTSHGLRAIGSRARVDREGGADSVGLIRGVSVTTRGEALGQDMWLDSEFVLQVAEAVNEAGTGGIKSRFTHPGLSGDGLGTLVGRVKDAKVVGDQAFADLHIVKSARATPQGDLGAYVMELAASDPDMFGTSIAFTSDTNAEQAFVDANQDDRGRFLSPDEDNRQQFPHLRLGDLRADDLVDSPAANPQGLFHHGDEIAAEADAMMNFALGLPGAERPQLVELDIDPQRIRRFVADYLERHHLTLISPETVLNRCRAMRNS